MADDSQASAAAVKTTSSSGQRPNVLLGCTGSVASLKIPALVNALQQFANVRVVSTEHALHFYKADDVTCELFRDADEWSVWQQRSDPVLHIELRRWADLFVIAPLDANTLAKLANGICDNLLTCVARAWNQHRPFLFAPAMNTFMWEHPLTARQVRELEGFGYTCVAPVEKTLVCGDKGMGAMAEVATIVEQVKNALSLT